MVVAIRVSGSEIAAMEQGRLGLEESNGEKGVVIPVQWQATTGSMDAHGTCLLPPGPVGRRQFDLRAASVSFPAGMRVAEDPASGQIEITEEARPVLRYNYRTNDPGALLDKVSPGNRIYARARSDYIHPLYGLSGEVLTRDWSVDHPHHRGIYWAWPEVGFGPERGDLHALQKVFARPTGKIRLRSGPVFAEIEAENQWLWNDRDPIVREVALIQAYRATSSGRVVDLAFQFTALRDGVTVARRETDKYGGLNVRMETPKAQTIVLFTGPSNAVPRRAWSDLSGEFGVGGGVSGLTVLQYAGNADYPGDWVKYPELSWAQPTFPAGGKRFPLRRGEPLVLRFRLVIHRDGTPEPASVSSWCDAFHMPVSPQPSFEDSEFKTSH